MLIGSSGHSGMVVVVIPHISQPEKQGSFGSHIFMVGQMSDVVVVVVMLVDVVLVEVVVVVALGRVVVVVALG